MFALFVILLLSFFFNLEIALKRFDDLRKRFNKNLRNVQQSRSGSVVSDVFKYPKDFKAYFFRIVETIYSTTKVQILFSAQNR